MVLTLRCTSESHKGLVNTWIAGPNSWVSDIGGLR